MSIAIKPDWRYRVLFNAMMPLLLWHSLIQARRTGESHMLRQKLGRGLPKREDRPLWIHMASVGEVNAAHPLIMELRRQRPELPVLVSTFTPTGGRMAREKFGPGVEQVYLPLDFDKAARAFVRLINPRCALIMETEIWPRLYYHCKSSHIPLVIVNGRLSEKAARAPSWVHGCYQKALRNVDRVLARSETDAGRFIALGVPAEKVEVMDNIKFAAPAESTTGEPLILPRPYVLAASTHDDEELRLSRAWLASTLSRDHLLVIVPRHPQRKAAILQQLRPLNAGVAVRSDDAAVTGETRIYLADTFGELQRFIAGAQLVFMGGSLVRVGGHNLLEVARQGKVVLCGPHMDNFSDERDLLVGDEAALGADGAQDMINKAEVLLSRPEQLEAMGRRAAQLIGGKAGVVQRYIDALAPYLSA